MDFEGRYQLRELISEGNGGKLYHAVRREGEKEAQVLVKELSQEQGLSGGEELRLLSLSHPRLLSYEAVFEGRFLVMEELSGISLARELERMGSFPENEVISILSGICEGLAYLHGQTPPFIHGDLKPSNIIRTEKGPVIIDLDGSLKNTSVRTQGFGTNGYAAPEQYEKDGVLSPATDIYNLGAMGLSLLSGIPPAALPIRKWQEQAEPMPALGIAGPLWEILMKCIRRDPRDRYRAAAELQKELGRLKKRRYEGEAFMGRKGVRVFLSACFLLLLLGGTLFWKCYQKDELLYQEALARAGESHDYREVLLLKPGDVRGYERFLAEIEADGCLDQEEEQRLKQLLLGFEREENGVLRSVSVLSVLQNNRKHYEDICIRAGEICLFYGQHEALIDRYHLAGAWFRRVPDQEEARSVLEMERLLEKIERLKRSKKNRERKEGYQVLWKQMMDFLGYERQEEQRLLAYREVLEILDRELAGFLDAVSGEEVETFLEALLEAEKASEQETVTEEYQMFLQKAEEIERRLCTAEF